MLRNAKLTVGLVLAVAVSAAGEERNNPNINDLALKPKEVVEQLWSMAARGDLLTVSGWTRASQFFTKPEAMPGNQAILVVSNYFGVVASIKGKSAEVQLACERVGQLDSRLRFTPAPQTNAYEIAEGYHLVATHRHIIMYGPDGKTRIGDKEIPESVTWQIEGSQQWPPWTTVNTAIRYVLEQKLKTTDATVRKNADETIAQLLALH